uniref:glutamate carboxypeptidase II n=1 Tax=Biomphalaria glabrata TaxID=6526 RepID=A0A2C9LCG1_BIOGL
MKDETMELESSSSSLVFSRKRSKGLKHWVTLFLVAGPSLAIGLLIGKFAIGDEKVVSTKYVAEEVTGFKEKVEDSSISQLIMDAIDPKRIGENVRLLSSKPHLAGHQYDFELVSLMQKHFQDHGLRVQTTPYDVLLSYPSETTRNSVRVLDEAGQLVYDSKTDEVDVSHIEGAVPGYNAFAPQGLVEGEIVYVGYGRHIEYDYMLSIGVNVTGKLVLVKYGKLFRGSKVAIAESYGAIGVIIYSDPIDHTGIKSGDTKVYPETWWLPSDGVQRGTLVSTIGDVLTPGYPSNNVAYRQLVTEAKPTLPKIPAHPISYGAAYNIFRYMAGSPAPRNWTGGLNITYRLGPGFTQQGYKVQLNVTNLYKRVKVENVFGIIQGDVEPDRYVLFGNHRDAWFYGATDPVSGTAVLMEIARVMGDLVKSGRWKPRRSIMFCNWGAEEFGLVGSTEWVENYVATLRERVVGYINVDSAVSGNHTLKVASTPLFHNVIYQASLKVPNPNPLEVQAGRTTVYDTWLNVTPYSDDLFQRNPVPRISSLGSGSDYVALLQIAGITSVDLTYTYSTDIYDISYPPLYHTEYERFDSIQPHFDRDFEFHAALARVVSEMTRSLSDSLVLPFSVRNYADGLEKLRQNLHIDYGLQLKEKVATYDLLKDVVENFTRDALEFETQLLKVDSTNPYALRSLNDRIMLLERAFLSTEGLPRRPMKKHVLFAENSYDIYTGSSFPGLVDLLFKIEHNPERWEQVRRHFSAILFTIQSAGATLRDVTGFMSETL